MSVNRAIIVGNLGKTPELRRTPSGEAVCDLSVATSEHITDKQGVRSERTEWHKVVVWGRSAESCVTYLGKGRPVCVEGRLRTRKWDDRDGHKRWTTEIVASRVHFLPGGARPGAASGAGAPTGALTAHEDLGTAPDHGAAGAMAAREDVGPEAPDDDGPPPEACFDEEEERAAAAPAPLTLPGLGGAPPPG
ncbi:MAG TPA: single-stranded DNA-binding protein, partial [Polyangia bacterium]